MSLIATNKGGANFPLAPVGLQMARIYGIIDLGTHKTTYMGEDKGNGRFVRMLFELPNHKHVFVEEKGPEPFTLSIKFLLSTHEKSKLRKMLKGWKGTDMTEEEQKGFDVTTLLTKVCMVNISHKKKKDGGDRAEIESLAKIPAEIKASLGPAINKPVLYEITQGRDATYNGLPKWIREEIAQSLEFTGQPSTGNADASPSPAEGETDEPF